MRVSAGLSAHVVQRLIQCSIFFIYHFIQGPSHTKSGAHDSTKQAGLWGHGMQLLLSSLELPVCTHTHLVFYVGSGDLN